MSVFKIYDFRKCSLEQANEQHATRMNIYLNIQELQDYYEAFHHFKDKAKDSQVELKGLKGMVEYMSIWQVQFEKYAKKPPRINEFTTRSFQTTCNIRI